MTVDSHNSSTGLGRSFLRNGDINALLMGLLNEPESRRNSDENRNEG